MRKLVYPIFILGVTWCLTEITLRALTKRVGHIDYLFGKRSYFLPPFHVPEQVPNVDTTTWFKYNVYDPQLGWAIGKIGAQPPYYSDRWGHRCSQQAYDSARRGSVLSNAGVSYDIVCLGNSFTHGDEVAFEQTWPYLLQKRTGLKTLNLGVGGYGIDQAWLRYKIEKPDAKTIILGMVPGDLDRACSQIYNLMAGGLKTKPMFVRANNTLQVVNQPALYGRELLEEFHQGISSELLREERNADVLFGNSWYMKFTTVRTFLALKVWDQHRKSAYRTEGEKLDLCIAILSQANQEAKQRGDRFIVLLLDNLNSFVDWENYGNPWQLFMEKLQLEGVEYLHYGDHLYRQFKKDPESVINKGLVHYSPEANEFVAEFIANQLAHER